MKKLFLLSFLVLFCSVMFAQQFQPPRGSMNGILQTNSSFNLDLNINSPLPVSENKGIPWNENGLKGCVADFNGDGVDDFIITGLHWVDTDVSANTKGFLRVYYGQTSGTPVIAYKDDDFPVVGNGSIDCTKLDDGTFLIAIQGGAKGNWTAPYTGWVYKLTAEETTATFEPVVELDNGAGRGSILFLDIDMDGYMDIFQLGWADNVAWKNQANVYINEGANDWWNFEGDCGIRAAANTFAFAYDMNNDGKTDIIFPIQSGSLANGDPRGIMIYYNNGDGTFDQYNAMSFYSSERLDDYYFRGEDDLSQIQLVDFDGDGWMDIIFAGSIDNKSDIFGGWEFTCVVLKNKQDGTFEELPFIDGDNSILMGGQRGDWVAADFDGDGIQDLIGGFENQYRPSGGWSSRTYFFKGKGDGTFEQTDITLTNDYPDGIPMMCRRGNFGRMLTGDFNGDKQPDLLVFGAPYTDGIRVNRAIMYLNVVQNYQHGTKVQEIAVSPVAITAYNNRITVSGAANQTVSVYSITGVLVKNEILTSGNASFTVNAPSGIYIVKAGSAVQKVILK